MIRLSASVFLIGMGLSTFVVGALVGRTGDWQSAAALSGSASVFWFLAGGAMAQRGAVR